MSTVTSAEGPQARLAHALATTTGIQILSTLTALALTAIAPTVAAALGVGPYFVGYQISLIYAAGAFASASAGTLVDRYGAVRIEQFALACYAFGLAGLAAGWLPLALLASLTIGVGYGVQNPASSKILNAVTPRHRRHIVFSIKQAGVPIGGVVASLGFPLLAASMGWRRALLVAIVPSIAMIALLARDHAGEVHDAPERQSVIAGFLAEQRLVWRGPALRILAVLGMLYSSIQLSLSAYAVTMLVARHWSLVGAGAAAGLIQLFGAIGRVSWGIVADRRGSGFGVLAVIGFVSMMCMMAMTGLPYLSITAQLAVLALFGFCISGWNGVLMAEATHHCAPADIGRVIGGALVYTFIGVTVGPAAFAVLYEHCGSYELTFLAMSVIAGAGGVIATVAAIRRPT
jgi:MFS family permease